MYGPSRTWYDVTNHDSNIKVVYGPSRTWYDVTTHDSKIVPDTFAEIHGLKKYTNYTMQVNIRICIDSQTDKQKDRQIDR